MKKYIFIVFAILLGISAVSIKICIAFENPPMLDVTKPSDGNTWVVGPGDDFAAIEDADSNGSVQPGDTIQIKAGTYRA